MAKKLKNYNVLLKALNNFPLVNLNINVLRKEKNIFEMVKMVEANGWPTPYLSFIEENNEPFTLGGAGNRDGKLEYSLDTKTWTAWEKNTEIESSSDGRLYVRGTGNSYIGGFYNYRDRETKYYPIKMTENKRIQCIGNIENLLDYKTVEAGEHPKMDDDGFFGLFHACHSLTKAPELPATTLTSNCYRGMFSSCTSLVEAPKLPATTLAKECYEDMFFGCTSLTAAPELPATTLTESCYDFMFGYCSSLTKAPVIHATTLADYCCNSMFRYCNSLTEAPELPAKTTTQRCYSWMFAECTSLVTAPNLPATTLGYECYVDMFSGCNSLTGQIHCAKSTANNQYKLASSDISTSSATIVFDL